METTWGGWYERVVIAEAALIAFDKSPGPVSPFPPRAVAPTFRFLLMSKRVTMAMSRIATSPPKTPLAIIAAGAAV